MNNEQADQQIDVTIYTDPLCCWSWAFEPQLQQLQNDLAGKATWQYRMGGLIPSWKNFHDEVNAVTRPVQMGPVWMHAGQIANKPINHLLWMKDPPASSYPACIAVKCAQLQSEVMGEIMLRLLRETCMTDGENIARQQVLFSTAEKLAATNPAFNLNQWKEDYLNDRGLEAFRADLDLVRYHNINRFPTLIIKAGKKAIMIPGFRHYQEVLKAIEALKPGLTAAVE